MQTSQVRCWAIHNWVKGHRHDLWITYPDGFGGHQLISCLNCGAIYSVSVTDEIYRGPPLQEILKIRICACGRVLAETTASYPELYLADGGVEAFKRPSQIPDDNESIVKSFPEIYS